MTWFKSIWNDELGLVVIGRHFAAAASLDAHVGSGKATTVAKATAISIWVSVKGFDEIFNHKASSTHSSQDVFPAVEILVGPFFAQP
jgi:hypothetical protein